jgi:hypothetical protein
MPRNADARPLLTLGVVAHSRKENERRLPIHPMHFQRIDADLRDHIYLENGYGESFGVTDEQLAPYVGGLLPRDGLLGDCDVIVLPKLQPSDLAEMREGQIVWGWPHCVQDAEVTQLAIDRRLTLIAFEAMNHWARDGGFLLHVFHKNNELAGYCSVLHALELIGTTGIYGRRLCAAVIGFGATARGAVTALNAHGVGDVRVLTNRMVAAVGSPIHAVQIVHLDHDSDDPNSPARSPTTPSGAGAVPGRERHRRQLRAAGHRRSVDLPHRAGPRRLPAGKSHGRRVLRRGDGLQLGPPNLVHRSELRGR